MSMKFSVNSVWENKDHYDVAVIGAGHAGCEAALACARLGLRTIVFTVSVDSIALMPCNPNIGGTSKGHLVREVDALGGEMGKVIDRTFIQSKMLNKSKGPCRPLSAGPGRQGPLQQDHAPGPGEPGEPGDQAGGSGEHTDRGRGRQKEGNRRADLLRRHFPVSGSRPVHRHLPEGQMYLRGCEHQHRPQWSPGRQLSDRVPEGAGHKDVSLQDRDSCKD